MRNSAGWLASACVMRRGTTLKSSRNALMIRLIKAQCLVGSRSRTILDNGVMAVAFLLRGNRRNCQRKAQNIPPDEPAFQILTLSADPSLLRPNAAGLRVTAQHARGQGCGSEGLRRSRRAGCLQFVRAQHGFGTAEGRQALESCRGRFATLQRCPVGS